MMQEFENWMVEEMRWSAKTVHNTVRMLSHMIELGANIDDRDSMNDLVRRIWQEKGNQAANGYIKIANRYLKYIRKKELKYFKEYDSFVVKLVPEDDKRKLLYAASKTGRRENAMFMLLFGTGVRLQEDCDLRLADISADRIRVRGKGQKVREIYLPPEVREAIGSYMQTREATDHDYLFTTERGRMSYEYFRRRCEVVAMKAGVKFHPHMARHTYATEMLKQGVSVYYVSRLLGHEDLSSTQIYLHPSQDAAIQEAKKVKFFLGRIPAEVELMLRSGFGPESRD